MIVVDCWLAGAQGQEHVRASIHVRSVTFNDEELEINQSNVQSFCLP